jgi:hypothetical protein
MAKDRRGVMQAIINAQPDSGWSSQDPSQLMNGSRIRTEINDTRSLALKQLAVQSP